MTEWKNELNSEIVSEIFSLAVEINFNGKPWKRRLASDRIGIAHRSESLRSTVSQLTFAAANATEVETFPATFNGISFPVIPVARVLSCLNRGFKVPPEIVHSTCTWRLRARGRPIRHPEFKVYIGIRFRNTIFSFFFFIRNVANFIKVERYFVVIIVTSVGHSKRLCVYTYSRYCNYIAIFIEYRYQSSYLRKIVLCFRRVWKSGCRNWNRHCKRNVLLRNEIGRRSRSSNDRSTRWVK